jgi:hypothetical protein
MKIIFTIFHLTKADFFERARRYSFLFVLAVIVLVGYLFVPPVDAGYRVLQVGTQRGIYNSAWIGLMFGLTAAMHLPLLGFYLVKNAISRDRQTRVGQIIASTPISKLVYVIGKWFSNLAVLILILCVLTVMGVVMQLIRAEDTTINLWAIITPIWLMGLPILAIAAALAVLFECVPFLNGGLGNVIFFFIWLTAIGVVISGSVEETTGLARVTRDPFSYTRQLVDIQEQVLEERPDAQVSSSFINSGRDIEGTFIWRGIDWPAAVIFDRLIWLGLVVVFLAISAITFDRFDPARSRTKSKREGIIHRLSQRITTYWSAEFLRREPEAKEVIQVVTAAQLTSISTIPNRWRFFGVLVAELKLMLKGRNLVWYFGAILFIVLSLLWPLVEVRRYLSLVILLWPITLWSWMGNREKRYQTDQIIFSVAHPLRRQLSANWIAGFIVALITCSCITASLIIGGQDYTIVSWVAGAAFIPSLALAFGIWSGGPRLFELVYILWWYLGPVEGVPVFEFMGVTHEAIETGVPIYYLIAAILLFIFAIFGRRLYFEESIL